MTTAGPAVANRRFVETREFDAGMQVLESAMRARRGAFLTVSGARGAGKTTIARELAGRSRALGIRVARGRCWPDTGADELWPWPAVARRLGDQELAAALDGERCPRPRFRLLAAAVDRLRANLQQVPTVVVLDDLHHADQAAIEFLRLLVDEVATVPAILVATYDPTAPAADPALGELSRDGTHIDLPPLRSDEVAAYLDAHALPTRPGDVELALRVSDGNPGRLALLVDRGIGVAIARRLAELPPVHADVVRAAAVLGARATADDVGLMAGVATTDVLRVAHASGLVEVVKEENRIRVPLAPLRAAILADAGRAVEACRATARALRRTGSVDRAAELLGAAVAATAEAGAGPGALLLVERARAVLAGGRLAEARPLFTEAAAAAEDEGDHIALAEAALGRAGIWVNEHRSMVEADQVVGLLRKALARLPPEDRARQLRLEARLAAEEAYRAGVAGPAFDLADRARELDDRAAQAEVLSLVHHLLLGPRHAHARLALADELIAAASEAGDAGLALVGRCWRTVDLFLLGDPTADRMHAALRDHAAVVPVEAIGFVSDAIDVMRLIRAGRLDDAERAAERCFARGSEVGDTDALAWYGGQLVLIRWLQGRAGEVVSVVEEIATSPTLAETDCFYVAVAACVAAACGELDQARAALDRLIARGLCSIPESSNWLMTMYTVADAARNLDDAGAAREVYDLLLPYADLPAMASLAVVCLGSTHRALGVAALTFGDLELAVTHLEEAVAANRRLGDRPFAAIAAADLAAALLRRDAHGDREQAVRLLRDAAAKAQRMDMTPSRDQWTARADVAERSCGTVRLDDGHWVLTLNGDRAVLPDRVGMRYLAALLRNPGVNVPAVELAGGVPSAPGCRDTVLDERARAAYQRRIGELTAQLDEADRVGSAGRSAGLQAELDALIDQLGSATGLGGRARLFPSAEERARTGVTKAIRRAVDEIRSASSGLGAHFRDSIVTGLSCRYTGDVRWTVTTNSG